MTSGMMTGAIIGGILGVAGFVAMRALSKRVQLQDTKTALNLAAIVDLVLFPVLGAFAGGLVTGD